MYGRAGLVLEQAGDLTLAQRLRVDGRLPLDLLQRWGEDLLKAVAYLEEKGVPHRDLKPDNPLEAARERPTEAIDGWAFPQLRQYVHYLVRHERFADGYSSPILESLVAGHLQQVADRLESDDSL